MSPRLALLPLLLAACGAAEKPPSPPAEAPSLIGVWDIVAVDGKPPRSIGSEAELDRRPAVRFTETSYGGSSGCNSFGGTGLRLGDRFYGDMPMMTAMGCGDLSTQETVIASVLSTAPALRFDGADSLRLQSAKGALSLRRRAGTPPVEAAAPPLLAGTRWLIRSVGSVYPTNYPAPLRVLSFEADRWEAALPCRVLSGSWEQEGRRVTLTRSAVTPRPCDGVLIPSDEALGKMLSGSLEFSTGPNQELVMAGAGGWLTGEIDRAARRDDADMLAGRWQVAGSKAWVHFGKLNYSAHDGCNRREGLFVAFGRALHTAPGPSTLAACPSEARVNAVLTAEPRIARTADGIALVSQAGRLDLTRLPGAPLRDTARAGLRAPLRATLGDGTLELAPRTFVVRTACGSVDGDWNSRALRFSGRDVGPRDCEPNRRFMNLFNGDVRAVTGANGELLLVSDHGKAVGQVER